MLDPNVLFTDRIGSAQGPTVTLWLIRGCTVRAEGLSLLQAFVGRSRSVSEIAVRSMPEYSCEFCCQRTKLVDVRITQQSLNRTGLQS